MSSFASLRAAKASKQSKSFIQSDDVSSGQAQVPLTDPTNDLYTLPPSLTIQRSHERGRGIYATQSIKRGSTILALTPDVHALSSSTLPVHCSHCAASPSELKRCTRCRVVWYCGASCQNADWRLHKRECPALSSSSDTIPNDAVRCLARMLWSIEIHGLSSVFTRQLASMQSSRPTAQAATHTHLAHALVRFMSISSPDELTKYGVQGAGGVADVVARFTTNAITLSTPTLTPTGVLLSPLAALFNHTCDPNAVIVFPSLPSSAADGPKLKVICIKDIEPGDEILTSYIDTTLPGHQRQHSLLETYDFRCACALCSSSSASSIDPRECVACPRGCGGFWKVPEEESEEGENESGVIEKVRCTRCRHEIEAEKVREVQDAVRLGAEGLREGERVQNEDPTRASKLTTNLVPLLTTAGLPPSSHPLLALLRLHQQFELDKLSAALAQLPPDLQTAAPGSERPLSNDEKAKATEAQETLDKVVTTQARVARGLSDILPEGHPVRALALAELGKLLAVDEPWPPVPSTTSSPAPQLLLPSPAPSSSPALTHPISPSSSTPPPSLAPTFPPHHASRLTLSLQTLQRAQRELEIGFGPGGGEVGREVKELLGRVESEAGVWREGVRGGLGR